MTIWAAVATKVGNGVGTINPFPAQWQDGKVKVIWPPEASNTDFVFPRKQ